MTTTRTYRCNLCSTNIDERTGVGIYFGYKNSIEVKMPLAVVENHVCRSCLEGLVCIANQMHDKKKVGAT